MTTIANGIVHTVEDPALRRCWTELLAPSRVGPGGVALALLSTLAGSSVVLAQLVSG